MTNPLLVIIPRYGNNILLNGHQSKILVTDFSVGSKKLLYSTVEVLTYAVMDSVETLVLWAPTGESGEFSVKDATSATLLSGSGSTNVNFYKGSGELTTSFVQKGGMSVMMLSNGLRVVLVDRATAYRFWAPTLTANPFAPANQTSTIPTFTVFQKFVTDVCDSSRPRTLPRPKCDAQLGWDDDSVNRRHRQCYHRFCLGPKDGFGDLMEWRKSSYHKICFWKPHRNSCGTK